ncbi:MAG: MarC family protein [Candidatus Omnitrophica bacterium]|nr:MarC family protein [Candidatus Omnitrophota bacterium]MBU1923680.1 MarC family protein [Candidatus Omnitrophota bacterium]MBU2063833.1 MarC family protein [Candidatus Omnitrophota bacterium]
MMEAFKPYILSFIPLFVAVDAIGNIPIFLSLVEGSSKTQRRKIILDAVITATVVAVIFMFIGKWVFSLLGITIPDFQIAGGALLFVISVRLLLPGAQKNVLTSSHDKDMGVFPLGTPLITGPAVLATTLMMMNSFGVAVTLVALILNMFFVWITLVKTDTIMKMIGSSGTRALSKIMYILLAAIAVMMIRHGIIGAFLK